MVPAWSGPRAWCRDQEIQGNQEIQTRLGRRDRGGHTGRCRLGLFARPGSANGPYLVWDPYPQLSSASAWAKQLTKCANANGASIKRTSYAAGSMVAKAVAAQGQGVSPDILIVSSQDVSTLVADKLLAPDSATHLGAPDVSVPGAGASYASAYGTPTSGDVITIPVQADTKRYAIDDKIIACLQASSAVGGPASSG